MPALYKLVWWAFVSADLSVPQRPPADKTFQPWERLSDANSQVKFVCFVFTEQERKLRANDREYNLSFKYAVSRKTHFFIHLVQ